MDSLANYGSDDDYDDSSDEQQKQDWRQDGLVKKDPQTKQPIRSSNQADANYEEVQMDLSEESNDGSRNGKDNRDKSSEDERRRNSPHDDRSREDYRSRRGDDRYRERSRSRERKDEDKLREKKDDRYGSKSDRYSRDNRKDSYRDRKGRRSSSKDRRRSSSRDRRRSSSRDRRRSSSRDRRRSSSRERRFSRSPRRDRSRRSRSRSRSRGRYGGPQRRYGYPNNKNFRNETSTENQSGNKDRFFMPGITGKYRDQIEKRKLLWQKKDPQKQQETESSQGQNTSPPASTSRVTKIWEATTFAQDQDGKVASKFKRLMGIKGQVESTPVPPVDIIKKQEEMFSSMEQQYEVARTATHTMRGVGLGFSSNYPR